MMVKRMKPLRIAVINYGTVWGKRDLAGAQKLLGDHWADKLFKGIDIGQEAIFLYYFRIVSINVSIILAALLIIYIVLHLSF